VKVSNEEITFQKQILNEKELETINELKLISVLKVNMNFPIKS